MRIKMTQSIGSATDPKKAGVEYDVDEAEARSLIQSGLAIDPSGKIVRKAEATQPERQTLDRPQSTPIEKLPSSLPMAGHPYKDPAQTTLTTDRLAAPGTAAPAGILATNAPSPEATRAANERLAPLSENQPGKATAADTEAHSADVARPHGKDK